MRNNTRQNIGFLILSTCIIVLSSWTQILPQNAPGNFARSDSSTTKDMRNEFRCNLYKDIIMKNFSFPLSGKSENSWKGAYWGCEISYFRDTLVYERLKEALRQYNERSSEFNRATLEALYTLYPAGFENDIRRIMKETNNSKHFALGAEYLLRVNCGNGAERENILGLMAKKFPAWQNDPILFMLKYRLSKTKAIRPGIADLLKHDFWKGRTVIFSFQRKNRNYEGITVILRPDGRLLKDSSGNIFHIKHLARSLSNLPGYLTNGSTPEGIYSVQKIDTSDNKFIGKTPLIVTALPYEVPPDLFFKDSKLKGISWSADLYRRMLPDSWVDYFPLYEAFYAGMAGRSEIVMHGTTIDPEFYKNDPYYPNTPSMGCMTAKEIYSSEDGRLVLSDQQKLIDAFTGCCKKEAFLVVINIDGKEEELSINEIRGFIEEPE